MSKFNSDFLKEYYELRRKLSIDKDEAINEQIAEHFGMTVDQFRYKLENDKKEARRKQIELVKKMKEEGTTVKEIAEELEMSESFAKMLINRVK